MLRWLLAPCFALPALFLDVVDGNGTRVDYTTTPEPVHFAGLDAAVTCKFQPNGFDCEGAGRLRPRFYYDIKMEDCKTFSAGGCAHNLNSFATRSDCRAACRDVGAQPGAASSPPAVFCRLQHDFGHCDDYYPRWYFDVTARRCRGFSYSGCGGNRNRFPSQQACAAACAGAARR